MIERAEEYIRTLGFPVVRVRYHEPRVARIEVPAGDLEPILSEDIRGAVRDRLEELGFARVSIDLEGYGRG